MPHTLICAMLKRNMCSRRKQGKAAVIKVLLFSLDLAFNQMFHCRNEIFCRIFPMSHRIQLPYRKKKSAKNDEFFGQ